MRWFVHPGLSPGAEGPDPEQLAIGRVSSRGVRGGRHERRGRADAAPRPHGARGPYGAAVDAARVVWPGFYSRAAALPRMAELAGAPSSRRSSPSTWRRPDHIRSGWERCCATTRRTHASIWTKPCRRSCAKARNRPACSVPGVRGRPADRFGAEDQHCEIAAYGMADDQLAGPARQPHPSAVALQLSRAARAACRLKVGISVGTDRCLPASPIGAEVVGRRL